MACYLSRKNSHNMPKRRKLKTANLLYKKKYLINTKIIEPWHTIIFNIAPFLKTNF